MPKYKIEYEVEAADEQAARYSHIWTVMKDKATVTEIEESFEPGWYLERQADGYVNDWRYWMIAKDEDKLRYTWYINVETGQCQKDEKPYNTTAYKSWDGRVRFHKANMNHESNKVHQDA